MAVRMDLKGDKEMARKIAAIGKKYPDRILTVLTKTAELIMTISKGLVPVDFGILRTSGHVVSAVKKGKGFVVEMVYGGAASDYALVQHEDLSLSHTVGGPKYLEAPLRAYDVASALAKGLKL